MLLCTIAKCFYAQLPNAQVPIAQEVPNAQMPNAKWNANVGGPSVNSIQYRHVHALYLYLFPLTTACQCLIPALISPFLPSFRLTLETETKTVYSQRRPRNGEHLRTQLPWKSGAAGVSVECSMLLEVRWSLAF